MYVETYVGGPAARYLASSERTANAEWRSGSTLISRTARPPKVVFFAQVKLERVLDVTDNNNQLRLNTSAVAIGPFLEDRPALVEAVVKPLQDKQETLYVIANSDAESHARARIPMSRSSSSAAGSIHT